MAVPMFYLAVRALKKEAFQYTHYPIRFNRKTRMVHFFRTNGTVLSKPWEEIFFTLYRLGGNIYEVVGLILDDRKETVLEVLPLTIHQELDSPYLLEQWEFIRRYMEEPEELSSLASQIEFALNVSEQKEGFFRGMDCLRLNVGPFWIIAIPHILLGSLGRWFAMRCGKIPHWPADVESQCRIAPGDPYIRDRDRHLSARLSPTHPPKRRTIEKIG